jgi:hypothetical protein
LSVFKDPEQMKNTLRYLLLVPLFLLSHFASAQVSLNHFALTAVTIIDANHRTPLSGQTILIEDNIIWDVFTDGSSPIPDSYVVLTLKGKFVLPGLIDTHVYLATDPSGTDNRAHTLNVLQQMLYSGITGLYKQQQPLSVTAYRQLNNVYYPL